jgi:anti-sigma-K factor RskA
LIGIVNEKVEEVKRASRKITISDNFRYTFRTWLLRLGMIGDEYRVARKLLLANLEGNIAFRNQGNSK